MAQTLKFGNKVWAAKEESVLAYNDINNNYKPLPFFFKRTSIGTRVNKDGLIETMGQDIARIDYTDSADGVLLLEPTSTNYSTNSELPSNWSYVEYGSGSSGTITTGKTDMFGQTNAVQVDFPSNAENASLWFGSLTSSLSSGSETSSVYIKLVGSDTSDKTIQIRTGGIASAITVSGTEFVRYTASKTISSNEGINLKLRPSEGTSSGGFSIIVCQPQSEALSYPTSYIPTSGSTVTRAAETCNNSGNSEVFNDSEGVLFVNISFNLQDNFPNISIFNDTNATKTDNKVVIYKGAPNSNQISVALRSGGIEYANITANVNVENYNKIVISYNSNEVKYYLNGFLIGTDNSITTPIGLDTLNFDNGGGANDVYGKTKEIGYYDTALTDAELETLTSYRNWVSMVNELNLNIIYNG